MARTDPLERGREAFDRLAWGDAWNALATADRAAPLAGADLERLGIAAYLTGRHDDAVAALERAHRALLEAGEADRAVRCAFWLGMLLLQGGREAQGGGWIARAARVLDAAGLDCVEHGYLLLPPALQALSSGEPGTALAGFEAAAEVADRFADPDLTALSRLGQGQALVDLGEAARGIALLDETMITVTSGAASPIVAGIAYCGVIVTCQKVFDVRRAQEWTAALSRWCETQQGLQPYQGQCLVHRSELLQLRGDWQAAIAEAREACAHLERVPGDPVVGMAQYQLAELHRLRGRLGDAEAAYGLASRWGHPVQPGLALLRLAQGRTADAEGAVRRVLREEHGRVERARVLAAGVEILLSVGDGDGARAAADELDASADALDAPLLRSLAAHARGAVLLAAGDAAGSRAALQRAAAAWRSLDVPYELARAQLLMARACRLLGDHDTAALELAAARRTFEQLGAAPALAEAKAVRAPPRAPAGLTAREVEVLALVAKGRTNREIGDELVISEKTVARHVSNLFAKLGVSSRAAATAFAYDHDLV